MIKKERNKDIALYMLNCDSSLENIEKRCEKRNEFYKFNE